MKPFFVGFCGKYKSGKTTLRDAVCYEFTKRIGAEEIKNIPYPGAVCVSFATPLKAFCLDTLGLSYPQVYGDDKDTPTKYTWDQVPNNPIPDLDYYSWRQRQECMKKRGTLMTARESMQWWGTDVFRAMDPDFFVNRLRDDHDDGYPLLLADDVRFGNEAALCDTLIHVVGAGGDTHKSETEVLTWHLSLDTRQISIEQAANQCVEFIVGRMQRDDS